MPTIYYRSPPIRIVSPPPDDLYRGEFDGLRIYEQAEQERDDRASEPAVMYTVCIEADAETAAEAATVSETANDLIGDIERVWVYAMGEPIRAIRKVFEIYHGPDGWQTNIAEIKEELRAKETGLTATVSIASRHWIRAPYWPLRRALDALPPYRRADDITRTLVELHLDALQSTRREGRLFFLAKALEIVSDLLPDRRPNQKERSLDPTARSHLTKPLSWLYSMSNNRADTRHIVQRGTATATLHPPMTSEELRDYETNADIVIRDVVCQRLGIDYAIIQSAGPSGA